MSRQLINCYAWPCCEFPVLQDRHLQSVRRESTARSSKVFIHASFVVRS
ncbi:hypothetical protein SETIT_1G015200v2 [Setaria italica]|uniref:Uncharacterized protein n=1 Tax=Setaria italica TaxID=4555 RepID=A0A368PGC8_SETIT|nr:hypothetical protein SETIT_1G015200v2 [Setaria italica]